VERAAFSRARRYLNFSPLAKWLALVCAAGIAVFYVALLIVLGLYADLMASRGEIPSFEDLSARRQEATRESWDQLSVAERRQLLQRLGVSGQRSEPLASTKAKDLAAADRELLWRVEIYRILDNWVGPEAANQIARRPFPERLTDFGALTLVVESYPRTYGRLLAWFASVNPWSWRERGPHLPNYYYLLELFIVAIAFAALRGLLGFLMVMSAARATLEAGLRLRRAVYHQTYRLGNLAVRAQGPTEAVTIFSREVDAVQSGLFTWLTVVVKEPVQIVLLLVFALLANFWLAMAFLLFAAFVWLVGGRIAVYYRRQGRLASLRSADQLTLIQESMMLMRLVKVYLMELFNQSRVERQLARYARAQVSRFYGEAVYRPLIVFLGTLAVAVLLFVTGSIILSRQLVFANAIMLATTLVSLYWPVNKWLEHRRKLRRARSAARVLFAFLDRRGDVSQVVGAEFLPPLAKSLEFDEVTLREPGTNHLLLDRVSLTIRAGARVALIGADESEKQALIYLLPRFLDPTSGEIRIDDHNLRWVTLDSLRAQIGMVLQQSLIFNDSVANNIGCGDPGYTLPQIIEAAKIAHAHQFIQKLPRGYETVIGDLGQSLSLAEQFQIALARAALRDPALLIIEEPTAPLNEEVKELMDDSYARMLPSRTTVFIPHRATTIRSSNQVILLHKGRVQAAGEHRELLAENELYRHLHYLEFHELSGSV
jgi:ATP-binding cassette subfamily B protein